MAFKWDYATDLTRRASTADGNSSNTRITPFTSKVLINNEWVPVYTPYDATDKVQGISWLTDEIKDASGNVFDAATGKTAVSPKGVSKFVGDNALVKDPSTYPGFTVSQQSAAQEVKGAVNFTGAVSAPNGTVGAANKLNTDKKIYVKVGDTSAENLAKQGAVFTGEQDITIDVLSVDATKVVGVLNASCIPQGAMSSMKVVPDEAARFALTADDVSIGDMVQEMNTGKIYVVIDMNNLDNSNGYTEMSAGNAAYADEAGQFSSNRTIALTGAVSGSAASNGSSGWTIATSFGSTVPITNGGTGATTVKEARHNLGLGDGETEGALTIAYGGTGATTASGALINLGIDATATQINYLQGAAGNIQEQLDGKSSSAHTHLYAGSLSAGGAATSVAIAENTNGSKDHYLIFSDKNEEVISGVAGYNNDLKYNSSSKTISANIDGNAATATAATTATTASQVGNTLTVKLNGVDTSTFNGSADVEIDITPSSIGAASSSEMKNYLPITGGVLSGSLYHTQDSYIDVNNKFLYGKKSDKTTRVQLIGMNASDYIQIGPSEDDKCCQMSHVGGAIFRHGEIRLKSDNIDRDSSSSSATYSESPIIFSDKNNAGVGTIRVNKNTSNRNQLEMSVYREIDGSTKYNTLNLWIDSSGNCTYSVTNPSNFRSAIGAAASSHTHSADNITSGTLPLSRGGVGATSKSGARTNLGITSGTGAPPSSGTAGDIYIQYA